ncbi:hypothetical protein D3C78_1185010 [compost metagenome]
MLLRQTHAAARRCGRLFLGEHRLDEHLAGHSVDRPGPAARLDLNLLQLLLVEQLQALTGTLQALRQVRTRLVKTVGLQFLHMATVGLAGGIQARQQLRLGKQKHMGATVAVAGGQGAQRLQRLVLQFLSVVHQQIDFLACLIQSRDLAEQAVHVLAAAAEPLTEVTQQPRAAADLARRHHHADDALLVAAGNQRLTQQGLATAQRAADHLH